MDFFKQGQGVFPEAPSLEARGLLILIDVAFITS